VLGTTAYQKKILWAEHLAYIFSPRKLFKAMSTKTDRGLFIGRHVSQTEIAYFGNISPDASLLNVRTNWLKYRRFTSRRPWPLTGQSSKSLLELVRLYWSCSIDVPFMEFCWCSLNEYGPMTLFKLYGLHCLKWRFLCIGLLVDRVTGTARMPNSS